MLFPLLFLSTSPSLSFAFFGCNRLGPEAWDVTTNPSSANLPQLRQTFDDVATLRPRLLFAGGDLVMGYEDDRGESLRRQLDAWATEARRLPAAIELVPIPGNHELNRKKKGVKRSSDYTYSVWKNWIARNGFARRAGNGPSPRTNRMDSLAEDESKMSYTFDQGSVRFIVLNTDTRSIIPDEVTKTAIAWIPGMWAANRLADADRDPLVKAVFVLGHRNLVPGSSVAGDSPVDPRAAAPLIRALARSRKARAYVCAHVHAWDVSRPFRGDGTGPAQLIAGNGGSPLEKEFAAREDADFGFVLVQVDGSGSANYVRYRRPLPAEGYEASSGILPAKADPARPL